MNIEKAFYWFKKSAHQGLIEAQNSLASNYLKVREKAINKERAFYWYKKSAIKEGQSTISFSSFI
jgi:TPR repeat protein